MARITVPGEAISADEPRWDFAAAWRRAPDKGLFLVLLAAWLGLFQFLGNSTFSYVDTPSLFVWMYAAYNRAGLTVDDAHGNLVPFVVLALLWWKRRELLTREFKTWGPGLLLVALALVLHVLGYLLQQPRLSIVALFTGIYGLMGLTWGRDWLRAIFFPWFLFVFAIPLGSMTESITFPLRLLVSKIVYLICQYGLAIDVVNEGTRLLKMPDQYEYELAPACSGIRSLIAIVAIAVIYAFMSLGDRKKRALLILSALPLAVVGNTFRTLAIVLAAEFGGQRTGNTVHESALWSLLPYVPAILGLMYLGRWLEKEPAVSKSPNTMPLRAEK